METRIKDIAQGKQGNEERDGCRNRNWIAIITVNSVYERIRWDSGWREDPGKARTGPLFSI